MIADSGIQKALRVKRAVAEYFTSNPEEISVQAKSLMPLFIRKGIFTQDSKEGKPIRELLRILQKEKMLHLIPQASGELKNVNYNWFFDNVGSTSRLAVQQARPTRKRSTESTKRKDSDELYVIDLCDQVLNLKAIRQHRFDFLLGDPGKTGRCTPLPVDAWYPELKLVMEYREKQHTESVKIMDQRMTVSGVTRGEQRRIYDERYCLSME